MGRIHYRARGWVQYGVREGFITKKWKDSLQRVGEGFLTKKGPQSHQFFTDRANSRAALQSQLYLSKSLSHPHPQLYLRRCQSQTVKYNAKSNKKDYVKQVEDILNHGGFLNVIIGSKATAFFGPVK